MIFEHYPWHTSLWQQVNTMQQNNRLPHALMISGAEGVGKTVFAEQLAANMLCLKPDENHQACGQCHSCQLLLAASHPDHLMIGPEEAGKAIKIDQIRELKDKQSLTPNIGKWKTVIINPANAMTVNASNSLLKLLEEPPANTLIMLVTSTAEQLPVTIRSRCQTLVVSGADIDQSRQWLQSQSVSLDENTLSRLHELTGGAPLQIQVMADSGMLDQLQQIENDFLQLLNGDLNIIQRAQEWQGLDLLQALEHCQRWTSNKIQQAMLTGKAGDSAMTLPQLWHVLDCITATIKLVSSQNNFNKILLIEDFMVSVVQSSNMHNQPSR